MRKIRRTTLITAFCVSVLAGLGLARKVDFTPYIWLVGLSPLLLLVRRKAIIALIISVLLGLGIGLWRGGFYMQNVHHLQNLTGRKVTIIATAASDSIYGKRSQIQFTGNKIELLEPDRTP